MESILEDEAGVRERARRGRLQRAARPPAGKSFEGYDFSQVGFPEGYGPEDLMSLAFVDAAQDFVSHGPTGRGKTRPAAAVGQACVSRGVPVRFHTAAELVAALSRARRGLRLEALERDLGRCGPLIIDELGHVPLDLEGSRLLFQVLSGCCERRGVAITADIGFGRWGAVFGDDKMAAAAIDRPARHGRLLEFNGPSRRMGAALMLGNAEE